MLHIQSAIYFSMPKRDEQNDNLPTFASWNLLIFGFTNPWIWPYPSVRHAEIRPGMMHHRRAQMGIKVQNVTQQNTIESHQSNWIVDINGFWSIILSPSQS